jgi:plastocyanin
MAASRLLKGLCLGFMALALAACGGSSDTGGGGGATSPLPNAAVTIKVVFDATNSGKYDPNPATAKVGDVVEWDFQDDQNGPHTATSDDGSTFNSQDKITGNKGDKYQFKFTKAGTFPYHCTFHANMKGTITVQ